VADEPSAPIPNSYQRRCTCRIGGCVERRGLSWNTGRLVYDVPSLRLSQIEPRSVSKGAWVCIVCRSPSVLEAVAPPRQSQQQPKTTRTDILMLISQWLLAPSGHAELVSLGGETGSFRDFDLLLATVFTRKSNCAKPPSRLGSRGAERPVDPTPLDLWHMHTNPS
jgi:hypothetical protein